MPFPDFFLTLQQIFDFMKKYMILLAASLLIGACGKDDNDTPDVPQDAERTVLIYMGADNNLASLANKDIKELKESSKLLNDLQNLIIYVDNTESTPPYIARVKDGVLVDSTSMEETLTADPAILEKMLRYTREKYHAKSYGLVLWGHADGWLIRNDSIAYTRAYGVDTGQSKSYWMNIPSMARAIANGMGSDRLRFILADCCNFLCIESAYELRNVTDYLIGSPAEIPERGAPYHLVVPTLFDTSATFYKSVIDTYYDYYLDEIVARPAYYYNKTHGDLAGYSVPLAATKSDELDNLAQATASLLETIHDKLTPEDTIRQHRIMLYSCNWGYKSCYDIYQTLSVNTSESDFNNWKPAFEKAVPYRRFSRKWLSQITLMEDCMDQFEATADQCGVVSMFFPNKNYKSLRPNMNTAIQRFQWNNVIRWQQYGW